MQLTKGNISIKLSLLICERKNRLRAVSTVAPFPKNLCIYTEKLQIIYKLSLTSGEYLDSSCILGEFVSKQ